MTWDNFYSPHLFNEACMIQNQNSGSMSKNLEHFEIMISFNFQIRTVCSRKFFDKLQEEPETLKQHRTNPNQPGIMMRISRFKKL